MASLVTVKAVNDALRLDLEIEADPQNDVSGEASRIDDIIAKIEQASDIVLDYIKRPSGSDTWNEDTAPQQVRAATILVVRCLLDDAEDSMVMLSGLSGLEPASLKNPIVALLYRLRDPALA